MFATFASKLCNGVQVCCTCRADNYLLSANPLSIVKTVVTALSLNYNFRFSMIVKVVVITISATVHVGIHLLWPLFPRECVHQFCKRGWPGDGQHDVRT